jgi:hypothetical protein
VLTIKARFGQGNGLRHDPFSEVIGDFQEPNGVVLEGTAIHPVV